MKQVLFFLMVIAGTGLFAQNTLEFSQVKLVGASTETVPAGKVWKIESVVADAMFDASNQNNVNTGLSIMINGVECFITQYSAYVGTSSGSNANPRPSGVTVVENTKLPIWIPAGTTLSTNQYSRYISVIEFNVTP